MKHIFTKKIQRFAVRHSKSKKGSTLIELVATIAILGIVSSISISALHAMANIAKNGEKISVAQRTCALLSDQFLTYSKSATQILKYTEMPDLTIYNDPHNLDGFMDADASPPAGDKNDYFISSDGNGNILFQKFDSATCSLKTITSIDNVKSIVFHVKALSIADKRLLEYTITTTDDYEITSGVVLNGSTNTNTIPTLDNFKITTTTDSTDPDNAFHNNVLLIRTESRKNISRS